MLNIKKHSLKFLLIASLLLLCLLFTTTNTLAQDLEMEKEVKKNLENIECENTYVAIENGTMLVRFDAPFIEEKLISYMQDIALMAYLTYPAKQTQIQAYDSGSPLIGATISRNDMQAYVDQEISSDELYTRTNFEDLRSVEKVVTDDLAVFDIAVNEISIEENNAEIHLTYTGLQEDEFWKQYASMALLVVEDCPWVDNVKLVFYDLDIKALSINAKTDKILDYSAQKIDTDEFIDSLQVIDYYSSTSQDKDEIQDTNAHDNQDEDSGWGFWIFILIFLIIVLLIIWFIFKLIGKIISKILGK